MASALAESPRRTVHSGASRSISGPFLAGPLGFAAGDTNVTRYVGNGSTNATDPSGRIKWDTLRPNPELEGRFLVTLDDGKTAISIRMDDGYYQCHSLTFGADKAPGGPYMVYGESVPSIIVEDNWTHIPAALAKPGDVLVWRKTATPPTKPEHGSIIHSAVLTKVVIDKDGRMDQEETMIRQKPGEFKEAEDTTVSAAQRGYGGGYFVYRKGPCDTQGKYPRAPNEWLVPDIHPRDADVESVQTNLDPYFGKKQK